MEDPGYTYDPVKLSVACLCSLMALFACGNPVPGADPATQAPSASDPATTEPKAIKPPFAVSGSLEGLMITWFNPEGVHPAKSREEIPEASRQFVRVQSLRVPPDQRLDPDQLYLADVRTPGADGSYPVRLVSRDWYEARIDQAAPAPSEGEVVLYMASWCGACKSAARYMTSRGVDFESKDIEKDAAANAEMQQKTKAAGKQSRGSVPVIDYKGNIMLGFDKQGLGRLIDQG